MIGIAIANSIGSRRPYGFDAQAQAHYNRVIADGGVVPAGLNGVNGFFTAVKTIYGTSDITTAINVGLDAHYLGYKLGAGAGATLGQSAQKLYSCAGSSGDVAQTTAASQPLLLAHSGASSNNYYYAPGVSGNYISTTSTYQTDDWDVEFNVKGKYSLSNGRIAGTRSISDGTNVAIDGISITLEYKIGSITYSAFALTTNINDVEYTVRVTRNSATGAVTFIKNGVTLTTIGSQIAGTLSSNSYAIEINGVLGGVQGFLGNINWVKFYISGSVVRYFNPATYNAATSQTQWTSTTGEVWTINTGTAATGYKGVLVDRTIVQGDGVDDLMAVTMSSKQYFSLYLAINGFSSSGNVALFNGGTANTHLIFQTSSSNINAYNGVTLPFVGEVANRLFCATVNFNSTNSDTLYNDANKQTGNTGTNTSSGINIFGGAGNSFSNSIYNTLLSSLAVDTTVRNTAIYNYIRSINNNAF
jgi:hypothetical protein